MKQQFTLCRATAVYTQLLLYYCQNPGSFGSQEEKTGEHRQEWRGQDQGSAFFFHMGLPSDSCCKTQVHIGSTISQPTVPNITLLLKITIRRTLCNDLFCVGICWFSNSDYLTFQGQLNYSKLLIIINRIGVRGPLMTDSTDNPYNGQK